MEVGTSFPQKEKHKHKWDVVGAILPLAKPLVHVFYYTHPFFCSVSNLLSHVHTDIKLIMIGR